VRLTADNRIVCHHDKDTSRTTGQPKLISETTLQDLKSLECGSWLGKQWSNERIPELWEVIELLPIHMELFIEVKTRKEIVEQLLEEIQKAKNPEKITVISFYPEVIETIKENSKDIKCNLLVAFEYRDISTNEIIKQVKKIEAAWKKCNIANNRYFSDINKWNPADIWLMTNEFVANQLSTLEEATTLETLNAKLQKYYDSGDCIGVSLKQITQGTGNWDLINNQGSLKDIDKVQFRGIHGTYDSIDFYIKWGVGGKDDIQFRNTAGDKKLQWQGEIKGVSAAQGKVGGGILDGILDKLGHTMIGVKNQHQRLKNATNPNSRQHAQGMSKTIYDKAKVHKLSGFKDDVNLISEIANESHSWRYSNYINYKLLDLVKSMSEEQKHKFVQAVYFYAASQSDLSSIHAKIK